MAIAPRPTSSRQEIVDLFKQPQPSAAIPSTTVEGQERDSTIGGSVITDEAARKRAASLFEQPLTQDQREILLAVGTDDEDPNTWADWVSPGLTLATTIPAGIASFKFGAAAGTPIAPAFGPFAPAVPVATGTIASVATTFPLVFASEYAGNAVEDYVEGREFDPNRAFQEALDAAQTDALIQAAFPLVGASVKFVAKGGKRLLTGKNGLTDESIDDVVDLQKRLKEYDPNTTLLPIQAARGEGRRNTIATQIAMTSLLSRRTVQRLLETYDTYMGAQMGKVIQSFRGATPGQQGQALRTFIQQTDQAIDDIVGPIYKNIQARAGKVVVDPSAAGKEIADQYRNVTFRGRMKVDPKTGKPTQTPNIPTPATKRALSELANLPNNLNFFEAHKRLSKVKQRLYNAQMSTTRDQDLIDVLSDTVDMYKKVMGDAAQNLDPVLKKEYDEVTKFYSDGTDVVNASFLKKAVETLDPADVGRLMTREGLELPVKQIKELKALAVKIRGQLPKDSKVTGLDLDPLEGIRRGYLEELFKLEGKGGTKSISAFIKKMEEPRFRATFNELFKGTTASKNIDQILKDFEILDNMDKLGSGFSLQVASAEVGALQMKNKNVLEMLRNVVPSILANRKIQQKEVDKLIGLIKTATEAEKRGVKLPPDYFLELETASKLLTGARVVTAGEG